MSQSFDTFRQLIRQAWCAQTSAAPQVWTPDNPALGQCAVTSALAQQIYGGEVLWCAPQLPDGSKDSHYLNLINGTVYDFTREQYDGSGAVFPAHLERKDKGLGSTYNYMCSFPATTTRLGLLTQRFNELGGQREQLPWLVADAPVMGAEIMSLMRAAGKQGYKLGLIVQGDEAASRAQLAKVPFMKHVSALLIVPALDQAHLAHFMQAHGIDQRKSAALISSKSPAFIQAGRSVAP